MFPLFHLIELLLITAKVSLIKSKSPNTGSISWDSGILKVSSTIVKVLSPANVNMTLLEPSPSIFSLLVKYVLPGKYNG